jgi:hypothetical protein
MREVPVQSQAVDSDQGPLRTFLNAALFDLSTPLGRRTNASIMGLVVLSVIAAMVSTLQSLPPHLRSAIHQFELAVSVLFMVEYLLRLAVARRPVGYAFSFYGLVDLLTWLPLLLGQGSAALRLLRIVRLQRTHSRELPLLSPLRNRSGPVGAGNARECAQIEAMRT